LLNALTIDIEDYYHVSAFEPYIDRSEWEFIPSRIEESSNRILDILDNYGCQATFFILGHVAKKKPGLIRKIHEKGHEIACHGYSHKLAYKMSPEEFRADVRRAKSVLEDAIGERIEGFRSTSFSIVESNLWCLDILIEEGFIYDSSIFPVRHASYGIPDWQPYPHSISRNGSVIHELPPSTINLFRNRFPIAGGAYLRFFPLSFIAGGIRRLNGSESQSAVIYLHPWELDKEQPRLKVKKLTEIRHYAGIGKLEDKFTALLGEFSFGTACDVIKNTLAC
jgi:polysaccharide deacetylase family protein (PEP-CTERM system associated)